MFITPVDIDARIEARVRPLEEDIRNLAETTNRLAETTQKAISELSDRLGKETKETHSLIRLAANEAKDEAVKVADSVAGMNRDRGKLNYGALGVLVSFVALLTGGGQVVTHWLLESRIAPIQEQVKAEVMIRDRVDSVLQRLVEENLRNDEVIKKELLLLKGREDALHDLYKSGLLRFNDGNRQ